MPTEENCAQGGGWGRASSPGARNRPNRSAMLGDVQLLVRSAGAPDAEAVTILYMRARRAAAAAGTIPPPVHDDRDTAEWIAQRVIAQLDCWVAETSSGAVAGLLVLDRDCLEQLYVDPDLTSQGVGGTLLALAKRERPGCLRLWTFVSNLSAQRFYLRHGFREVERTDGSRNEEHAPDIQYVWTAGPDR
jgi:GNAT superfamily N-acetyltransferase